MGRKHLECYACSDAKVQLLHIITQTPSILSLRYIFSNDKYVRGTLASHFHLQTNHSVRNTLSHPNYTVLHILYTFKSNYCLRSTLPIRLLSQMHSSHQIILSDIPFLSNYCLRCTLPFQLFSQIYPSYPIIVLDAPFPSNYSLRNTSINQLFS
jgi:hypothetical protein